MPQAAQVQQSRARVVDVRMMDSMGQTLVEAGRQMMPLILAQPPRAQTLSRIWTLVQKAKAQMEEKCIHREGSREEIDPGTAVRTAQSPA